MPLASTFVLVRAQGLEGRGGRVTHFVASVGTGGTITGAAHYLRAQNPAIRVIGADPEGSVLSGDTARPYLQEGIGEDFFPGTYDPAVVDRWVRISDRDAFTMARRVTREEGILAGESTGTAVLAALDEARALMAESPERAREAVFVVILPDGGRSYMSKLYNDEWLRANGLLATTGAVIRIAELLTGRHDDGGRPPVVIARTTERVGDAIETLQEYGISQMPVSEDAEGDAVVGHRRLDQREGVARPGVPGPVGRRAHGRRGDGPAAAADGRLRLARRRVRPAVRRRVRPRRRARGAPGRRRDEARPARVPDPPRRAARLARFSRTAGGSAPVEVDSAVVAAKRNDRRAAGVARSSARVLAMIAFGRNQSDSGSERSIFGSAVRNRSRSSPTFVPASQAVIAPWRIGSIRYIQRRPSMID